MVYGPRPEMMHWKCPWQKLALKGAWFRSFGPFLEFIVYLHWPKVWNTILSISVSMLFWISISSKISAHRVTEKYWSVFSCI
jgi:hypothetical protein